MRVFFVQAYAIYKGLFGWLNPIGYVSNIFLYPILTVTMYSIVARFALDPEAVQRQALGIAIYSMVSVVVGGITQSYLYDRSGGTITYLFASPVNRLKHYLSRAVLHYPNALLASTAALFAAWGVVNLDFDMVDWGGYIIALLVTAASITALGQFLGVFVIVVREWQHVFGVAVAALLAFTGVIIPLTVFPSGVQEVFKLLPMTNGMLAIRSAFAGSTFDTIYMTILREFLTGFIYYAAGFIGFVVFERVARRTGTLDMETL